MSKWKIKHEEFDDTTKDGRRNSNRSDATRDKYSQRMKEEWSDPEFRKRRSEQQKERWKDPEYLSKMKDAKKVTSDNLRKKTWLEDFQKAHGDKYDYSKVEYVNGQTKVIIICPIHGKFLQSPLNHQKGVGCPQCARDKNKINLDEVREFLEKGLTAKEIASEMGRNYETILKKIKLIRSSNV